MQEPTQNTAQELKNSGVALGLGVAGRIRRWPQASYPQGTHLHHLHPLNVETTEYSSPLDHLVTQHTTVEDWNKIPHWP